MSNYAVLSNTVNVTITNTFNSNEKNIIKDNDIYLKNKLKKDGKKNIMLSNEKNIKNLFYNISKYLDINVEKINFINLTNRSNDEIQEYLNICLEKSDEKKYKYIYDKVCRDLDKKFKINNYCDFKDDKCIAQRNKKACHEDMGCCYTFKYSKIDGMPIDTGFCNYFDMDKKTCSQKCITCKLFTCRYLRKHDIKFEIKDYEILDIFFNNKQKSVIKTNFFKTEDEIIKQLIRAK